MLFTRLREQAIDEREVISPLGRFDEFPGNRRQDGVERDSREPWPKRFHVFQAGGTGVVKFSAQHQEGLPSTISCVAAPRFSKRGRFVSWVQIAIGANRDTQKSKTTRVSRWTCMVAAILPNQHKACPYWQNVALPKQ